MNNKAVFIFIIFQLIWSKSLISQKMIVYDEIKNSELIFKFSPYEKDNSLPNYFISSMAHSQSKMRSYYNYKITSRIHANITKQKSNYYNIEIDIDSLKIIGDFNFKGFDFSRIVLPQQIQLSYQLIEINNNETMDFNVDLDIAKKSFYHIERTYVDSTHHGAYKLDNERLTYKFGAIQKTNFDSAILLIDRYYSEGERLLKIQEDLSELETEDIDKIKLQNIDLKYIIKKINKISLPNYASKLSLEIIDPAGYFVLYRKLNSQIPILQKQFTQNITNLDSLFYLKGIKLKENELVDNAKLYFNKSLNEDSNFMPSLYQLALIDFENNDLSQAKNKLNRILEINPNNNNYNDLANNIYLAMLKKGNDWNDEENYNEGLKILTEAQIFCDKNKNIISCDISQKTSITAAKYGMYTSFLSIAGAAMQRGRLDMTEDYLNTADFYQKENANAITNNSQLNALYTLLVTQYLSQSLELKDKYDFQKSKRKWQYADSICNAHKLVDAKTFVAEVEKQLGNYQYSQAIVQTKSYTPKSEIKINKEKINIQSPQQSALESYREHYEKGNIYYSYHRYLQAYQELKLAKEIKKQFEINEQDSLDSYLIQSAKEVILDNLKTASLYAWGSKYRAAEMMLGKAQEQVVEENLVDNMEIVIAIKKLKTDLQKQQDSKISQLFESKMLKARQSSDLKDFVSVEKYCNEAVELSKQNKNIPLDLNFPLSLIEKYASAIEYQKHINEAIKYRDKGQAEKSISKFDIANTLFNSDSLQKFNIRKTSLYSFVNEHPYLALSEAAISKSIENNNSELALDLWKEAIGYKWNINSALATKIMVAIAKNDKTKNPTSKKKELYNQRFGKNHNFAKYRKYYLKAF